MTYTEKELDQFLHGISLSLLSKKSAQHWRYDEETAKEIEWLEALERKVRADKADRKTEPQTETKTETQNSNLTFEKADERCKGCNHYKLTCDLFSEICRYEPKDEPQTDEFELFDREDLILLIECQKERIAELLAKDEPTRSKMEQVEDETRLTAKCLNCNNAKACKEKHWDGCVYEPKDEKTCETCRHWKYIAHEWQCEACKCQGYEPKDEPTPWCKYCQRRWENDCVGVAQCIRDMQMIAELYKASEDEPQTDCPWMKGE